MQMLAQSRANFFGDARAQDGKVSHAACRNGCGARIPPKLLDKHEAGECPKRLVPCPYAPCGAEDLWVEEIPGHKLVCANRPVVCTMCSLDINLLSFSHHEKEECTDRYVVCPYRCGKPDLKARLVDQHCNLWCKRRPIDCTNQCGETIPMCDVLTHKRECLRRPVRCLLGCGEELVFEERENHQDNDCAKRWVPCKWNNCEGTSADRKEDHENNECPWREIVCVCEKTILGQDYGKHLKNHCVKRMVDCRHRKCTMRIKYSDRAVHEKTDCQQRWVSCMFRDVPKDTELGLDVSEIGDEDYDIVESLAAALKVKDVESLDSYLIRVVGCGARVRLSDMMLHWEDECLSRDVMCGVGCGKLFCYSATQHHKQQTCVKREVTCSLGCMQKTKAEDMQHHEDRVCKFRKVFCAFGCGEIMVEYQRKKHEKNDCTLRFVDCTSECGETMRFEDLDHHLRNVCGMRAYRPPSEDYTCKRCSFENTSGNMLNEYGDDVFDWKCQVCKAPAHQKGVSVGQQMKLKFGSTGGRR
jgi:hypothetical protein